MASPHNYKKIQKLLSINPCPPFKIYLITFPFAYYYNGLHYVPETWQTPSSNRAIHLLFFLLAVLFSDNLVQITRHWVSIQMSSLQSFLELYKIITTCQSPVLCSDCFFTPLLHHYLPMFSFFLP